MNVSAGTIEAAQRYFDRCHRAGSTEGPLTLLGRLGLADEDARALVRAMFESAPMRSDAPGERIRIHSGELTASELEALRGAAKGEQAKETAARLGKGVATVSAQRKAVLGKLKAKNTAHAVALGYERGLLP